MIRIRRVASGLLLLTCLLNTAIAEGEFGRSQVVTDVPAGSNTNPSVANLIGADRFYNAGFTGQSTKVANVEAGHIWSGHESLTNVQTIANQAAGAANEVDRHATWVGSQIGGQGTQELQRGIAYGTTLQSGAIATSWNGPNAYALSFEATDQSLRYGYSPFFGTSDVINSSYGFSNPAGDNPLVVELDGLAKQNSNTAFVVSAGNSGSGTNTIGAPGSGYNSITVAALNNGGDNSYNSVASFSSRGPQDFYNASTNSVVSGVRAAVDIAAPGTNLSAAFYGGQTGGNNASFSGSTNNPSTTSYNLGLAGTSFAAPITAGSIALLKSASYNTASLDNAAARDTLVVKSVLQNSADKTSGWNNGQSLINNVVTTTQSLDYAVGAGKLNLDRAFDQYVNANTKDVAGLDTGLLGIVGAIGWDLGKVLLEGTNLYEIAGLLQGNSTLNVTLNWFRDRFYDAINDTVSDLRQADLNLSVIDLISMSKVAESKSLYNLTEHLSFVLPTTSRYGLQVDYGNNTFMTTGASLSNNVIYGLAWDVVAVPEPSTLVLLCVCFTGAVIVRRYQLCSFS